MVKIFSFVPRYFVSGVCFTYCIRHFKLGVLGPWEFLWRAGSYIFVCDSAVWSAGPVQYYLGFLLERMAGLYRFFSVWLCCSGYGTVEMVGGGPSFSAFSSLLSVSLAVG